MVEVHMQT
jgi:hypothetical protein